jgi:hypothetical protein
VVEELPSGFAGGMVPVVEMTIGVGIVPKGAADVDMLGDIVVVDVVIAPIVDVETVLGTVDDIGTGIGVMEGTGRGGTAGGCGAGMVVPGKSVKNDVAGCADSGRYGVVVVPINVVAVLPAVDMEDGAATADIVGAAEIDGVVAIVPGIADREVTDTGGVPGVI